MASSTRLISRIERVIVLGDRRRRDAGYVFRLLLDDDAAAAGLPVVGHVGVDLDHVAVGIPQIERMGDVVIARVAEFDAGCERSIIAVDEADLVLQLERDVIEARALTLRSIVAADVRQPEIVIGVTVADERRHVVGLTVSLVHAGDGIVELLRLDIVGHEQVGVAEAARTKEFARLILHQDARIGHGGLAWIVCCNERLRWYGSKLDFANVSRTTPAASSRSRHCRD